MSLFSGAGGLDLGLIKAGHEIIWANDFDHDAVQTYIKNIGPHIIEGDISKISSSEIPDCDVVVGGFPCQGFSLANRSRSGDDDRNKLYKQFVRVVKAKKPRYFLAENVKGILSLESGTAIKKIVDDFKKIGYHVEYKLFNTADYGVPQIRQRVIIAGTRKGEKIYQYPDPSHTKVGWIGIGDALKDVPEPGNDENLLNHVYSKYKVTNRNFTGHRTTDPLKPSPTILARGDGKGGVCAIQHPKNHRRMSVRESALVQTFPMNFEFFGKMNSMYRQIGNAVPVLFAYRLGLALTEVEK